MNLELRLSVEDSPNSAGVVVDAIRCCKVALDRGVGGMLVGPSAYFCKHPPQQFSDDVAAQLTDEFIAGEAIARIGGMNCLILAAGHGSRLREVSESKPLTPVAGKPLIAHVIDAARAAGATDFTVVTGHKAERVEASSPTLGRADRMRRAGRLGQAERPFGAGRRGADRWRLSAADVRPSLRSRDRAARDGRPRRR